MKIRYAFLILGIFELTSCFKSSQTNDHMNAVSPLVQFPEWSKDAVIYEVNVRQFTPEGTFEAFETHLPRLKNLGVDILWLMPVYPIGELNRKGEIGSYYAVKDYFKINAEFGSEEDFHHLVESAHELGMYVILDWVPNHTAWDNVLMAEHPEWYEKNLDDEPIPPPGTDWTDVIALDYKNGELRAYMISAMKYWLEEFDIDGFRCDVAGYVPTSFWLEAREVLNKSKSIFMLAEWEDRDIHRAFEMSYSWELEHHMQMIAKEEESAHDMTLYLAKMLNTYPPEYIKMNFTSNHDKNSWEGTVFDRFGKAAEAFAALTYVLEGMPLIYSGQEVGLTRQLRFFEKDNIDWGDHPFNALYDRLGKLKKDNPSLWNGQWGGRIQLLPNDVPSSIVSFARQKGDNTVIATFNLSAKPTHFRLQKDWFEGEYRRFKSRDRFTLTSGQSLSLPAWGYEIYIQ